MSAKKYYHEVQKIIKKIMESQYENIIKASKLFVKKIEKDKIIHVFGTGHSHLIAIEMFVRAGGLANINAILDETITTAGGAQRGSKLEGLSGLAEIIWDQYNIDKEDVMIIISNSGRNSVPVEMAMKAKEEGLTLIAITSLDHSKNCQSRHKSGKRLFEIADIIIDNCVPGGDSLLEFGGIKSGPGSSLAGIFIVNSILAETLKMLHEKGLPLPIFTSQNVDGYNNDDLYRKYGSRIKHM